MLKQRLVFWLFVEVLASISTHLVAGIAVDPGQVPIALLLIFFSGNSITARRRGIRQLALLTSPIQSRFFFKGPIQSLVGLIAIPTINISSPGKFFILILNFFWSLDFFCFSDLWLWEQCVALFHAKKGAYQATLPLISTTHLTTTCQSSSSWCLSLNWAWIVSVRQSRRYQMRKLFVAAAILSNYLKTDWNYSI